MPFGYCHEGGRNFSRVKIIDILLQTHMCTRTRDLHYIKDQDVGSFDERLFFSIIYMNL